MTAERHAILVTCPKGLEYLLETELQALGLAQMRVSPRGVYGLADLQVIYTLCLWSRVANRILLVLCEGSAPDREALYQLCYQCPWQEHFQLESTLAIHFQGLSPAIRSTMFGAQVIKDAIVDYCRDKALLRPTIDKQTPNIRLRASLHKDIVQVCLDITGYSLHQRGYRLAAGEAPLKENVAAALLYRAQWPRLSAESYALYDPCCGSGTLVIEAALMAAQIAPGLLRQDHALPHWLAHDAARWAACRAAAERAQKIPGVIFWGSDSDPDAIAMAKANAERAGVAPYIQWAVHDVAAAVAPAAQGLVISNPPYGERLGDVTALLPLYQQLGQVLYQRFEGWEAAILTASTVLAKALQLRSHKQYHIYNGALPCQLYLLHLNKNNHLHSSNNDARAEGATMFANRLKKNATHLQKWAKRKHLECYRVYDADLPEYAYAIDIYKNYVVLQEYAPPASIPQHSAARHRQEVEAIVPEILHIKPEHMIIKQRARQRGDQQYEKISAERQFLTVIEGAARLQVNLWDYLDTGLFLDHRLLRLSFARLAPGTRFLNCFCYTATASVHAALAGSITTNVDLSHTYLAWAEDNFRLNNLDLSKHQFVQYDCMRWLAISQDRFDVIFLDPPSFSNSKRMDGILDIVRDHASLISAAMRLLHPQGKLYFSTNFRQFKLSDAVTSAFKVSDMRATTIDLDFKRNPKIHHCYCIEFM